MASSLAPEPQRAAGAATATASSCALHILHFNDVYGRAQNTACKGCHTGSLPRSRRHHCVCLKNCVPPGPSFFPPAAGTTATATATARASTELRHSGL